jgi:hypothetical protein
MQLEVGGIRRATAFRMASDVSDQDNRPTSADRTLASRGNESRGGSDPAPLRRDRFQRPAPADRAIAIA